MRIPAALLAASLIVGATGCQDPNEGNGGGTQTRATGACCIVDPYQCSVTTREACGGDYKGDGTDCEAHDCYIGSEKFQLTICQCSHLGGSTTAAATSSAPSGCTPLPCDPGLITQQSQITPTNNPTTQNDRSVTGASCQVAYANTGIPAGRTVNQVRYDPYTLHIRQMQCPNQKWVVRTKIATLTLKQDITITIPNWAAPAAAPQADKTAFENWRTRLLQHEMQHEQIDKTSLTTKYKAKIQARDQAIACGDSLTSAEQAAKAQLDAQVQAAFMEAWNEMEKAQAQLDKPPGYPIVLTCP